MVGGVLGTLVEPLLGLEAECPYLDQRLWRGLTGVVVHILVSIGQYLPNFYDVEGGCWVS